MKNLEAVITANREATMKNLDMLLDLNLTPDATDEERILRRDLIRQTRATLRDLNSALTDVRRLNN